MGKIAKLDPHIANLIAAGEVIERASSVVKELVENSIDAKATTITITLTDAGLKEIIVKDDGSGMDQQDARMCFEPHATSKIKNENDLFNINTLGFRGEALPSIVAVSNFNLKTSLVGGKGIMYTLKGGKLVTEAVISCPKGTEISVRNLFFNTPARLQNLQSANVELSYIVDYVQKEALAHSDISFKLINNDRVVFQTFGSGNELEVLTNMYGNEIGKDLRDIFNDNGYYRLNGHISKLGQTRSNRNHIHIMINGRTIRSNNIIKAVLDGYGTYLMNNRFPICLIKITTDPTLVDVNVHPSKLEVRFTNEKDLLNMITSTIKDALEKTNMIALEDQVFVEEKTYNVETDEVIDEVCEENTFTYSEPVSLKEVKPETPRVDVNQLSEFEMLNHLNSMRAENKSEPIIEDVKYEELTLDFDKPIVEEINDEDFCESLSEDSETTFTVNEETDDVNNSDVEESDDEVNDDETDEDDFIYDDVTYKKPVEMTSQQKPIIVATPKVNQEEIVENVTENPTETSASKLPKLTYIGQLFGTYLVCQDDNVFYLIDQHAANERINYEKISRELSKDHMISYELLVPFVVKFSLSDAILINEKMSEIETLGIIMDEFGGGSFTVREVPIWIFKGHEKEYVEEIINQIINNNRATKGAFLDGLAKSLACKKSIKANSFISQIEVEYLIDNLGKCKNPYTCPHGRPTIIKYTKYEIEKWFKRVV